MRTHQITLSDQELRVLMDILDIATRAAGLKARLAVNLICARLDARVAAGDARAEAESPEDLSK